VMQQLLQEFKYRGKKEVGIYFGRRIGESLLRSELYSDIDVLVPLPLFPKKEKKRGYNQSAVICEGIAGIMKVPLISDAIRRRKNTATQTHKNRTERWENVEGKFE